jgi:hypothetical protein
VLRGLLGPTPHKSSLVSVDAGVELDVLDWDGRSAGLCFSCANATCPIRRLHLGDGLAWLLRIGPSSLTPRPPESSSLRFVATRTHARAREFLVHALQRLVRTVQRTSAPVERASASRGATVAVEGHVRRVTGGAAPKYGASAARPVRDLDEAPVAPGSTV